MGKSKLTSKLKRFKMIKTTSRLNEKVQRQRLKSPLKSRSLNDKKMDLRKLIGTQLGVFDCIAGCFANRITTVTLSKYVDMVASVFVALQIWVFSADDHMLTMGLPTCFFCLFLRVSGRDNAGGLCGT